MAVAVLTAGACDEPDDLQPSVGVVYGAVLDQDGGGIPGVSIRVYLSDPASCEGRTTGSADGVADTGADGRYATRVKYIHVDEEVLCAVAVAAPPWGSGVRGGTAAGVELTVRHESRVPPMDSARVDFVLTPTSDSHSSSGAHSPMRQDPAGVRQVYLQDPEGNWVEINDAGHPETHR